MWIIRYDLRFATLMNLVEGIFKKGGNSLCKYMYVWWIDIDLDIPFETDLV